MYSSKVDSVSVFSVIAVVWVRSAQQRRKCTAAKRDPAGTWRQCPPGRSPTPPWPVIRRLVFRPTTLDADVRETHRGQPLRIVRTNSDPHVDHALHHDARVRKGSQLRVGGTIRCFRELDGSA